MNWAAICEIIKGFFNLTDWFIKRRDKKALKKEKRNQALIQEVKDAYQSGDDRRISRALSRLHRLRHL